MKLEGIDNLKRFITALVLKPDELEQISRPTAEYVQYKLIANAPQVTGEFASSIEIYEKKNRTGLTIGPHYGRGSKGKIGHLLEYGHVSRDGKTFVPGTGFIQKTWMEVKSKAEKDMIANLEKKITQNFNG